MIETKVRQTLYCQKRSQMQWSLCERCERAGRSNAAVSLDAPAALKLPTRASQEVKQLPPAQRSAGGLWHQSCMSQPAPSIRLVQNSRREREREREREKERQVKHTISGMCTCTRIIASAVRESLTCPSSGCHGCYAKHKA